MYDKMANAAGWDAGVIATNILLWLWNNIAGGCSANYGDKYYILW